MATLTPGMPSSAASHIRRCSICRRRIRGWHIIAEISNQRTDAARLAVTVDVLQRGDSPAPVVRGPVVTFGPGHDLLWLRVSLWVGQQAIFTQEVMVQPVSLNEWPNDIERLARGELDELLFPVESPELIATIQRMYIEPEYRIDPTESIHYSMLLGAETGIAAGADGVSYSGPVTFFHPTIEQIRQFAHDLRAEARLVDLLDG